MGRFLGIDVRVHATLPALFALLVLLDFSRSGSSVSAALSLATILSVFLCVLLHEYGHALVARRYGIATRSITLLPIGGIAELEYMPEEPRKELAIALAGPAVNVVLAVSTLIVFGTLWSLGVMELGSMFAQTLSFFALINLALFAFNLLPALPMDGGRVLRALLAMRWNQARATAIAASVGKFFAVLLAFAGLFLNPILLIIAIFVWFGAQQESLVARFRASMSGANVGSAMVTRFETLDAMENVESVVERMIRSPQQDYPVLDGERLVGVLSHQEVLDALSRGHGRSPIGAVVAGTGYAARPTDDLETVGLRVLSGRQAAVAVVDGMRVIGLLTRDSLGEFLAFREARARPLAAP